MNHPVEDTASHAASQISKLPLAMAQVIPVDLNYYQDVSMDELESAWVRLVEDKLNSMAERQSRMENRQEGLESQLTINNTVTREIHEILSTAKGAFKFFGWMAQFAGMAVKIAAFLAATYATAKLAFPHLFKS